MEVYRVGPRVWEVYTRNSVYHVYFDKDRWKCGCPEYERKRSCDHIREVWDHEKRKES